MITDTTVDPDILLCDYIDYWLEGKKPEIKKATYEGYVARSLRIKEYFKPKGYRVIDITPHIIDTYYKWCLRCGKKSQKTGESKPLSVRSTRSYKSILNAVFELAMIDGLITRSPTRDVHVHGRKNKEYQEEMLFLTKDENAVDFKKKQITIRHTVVRVSTIDEADSTKTPRGTAYTCSLSGSRMLSTQTKS